MLVGGRFSSKPDLPTKSGVFRPKNTASPKSLAWCIMLSGDGMATTAFHLLVRDPVAGQSVVRLVPGERVTIGRAPTNQVVVHDDRASRVHAEIHETAGGWAVRDLESRNGTLVEDEPFVGDRLLAPGDRVGIGRVEIVLCAGEPLTDPGSPGTVGRTSTSADAVADSQWHQSIVHRRARGRLLEDIRQSAASVPRVGRAAAELCRLAFALGRSAAVGDAAALALDTATRGVDGHRGVVLLSAGLGDSARRGPGGTAALEPAAMMPDRQAGVDIPPAAVETVLATDEAVQACSMAAEHTAGSAVSMISAPVRLSGRPVGVLHVEIEGDGREATTDDLEFVMAVSDALGVALENLSAREALSTKLATTADEIERLRKRLREESRMVGASAALQAIIGQVQRVAGTKATVLVCGESGAGKELVASAIHDASDRRGGPFVCLNCAALSETLLESELFGHEKGAFTGATERKVGKFEAAHKGTLFLDEIGEMSAAIQAKFLRVLEGHPFERVGGSTRVQVDVRVVAATNRDLEQAVAAGEFRRDLYFRLKVVEIVVPPLRKRPDDIEVLAYHFLERFVAETGRRVRGFTLAAVEAMRAYHWPGNIRELRNCVERAVVLSQADEIDAADLSLSHLAAAGDTGKAVARSVTYAPQSLEEIERKHILDTLEAVGGNKTKAAAILGIERSTLDRKLARWAKA
jgi:transcriptional regulator with GAF, ATPase, and Fis domain